MRLPRNVTTKFNPVATAAEQKRRRRLWLMVCGQLAVAATVIWFALVAHNLVAVIVCVIAIIIGNIVLVWHVSQLASLNWAARQRLRKSGYRVCPECMYDLAASPEEGNCPECGWTYSPGTLRDRWEQSYKKMLEKTGT
ncbi:MAG: hypothetical protein JSR77_05175 [Planctomycetes bacterium]|nr:hypothetical protein [Planctomycetota bacterium]